jgi:Fur family transcriptional regulator, ferric uptake regulator
VPVTNQLVVEVQERVRSEAKRRGVRWTNQRQVIVEQFLLAGEHLTADELLVRAREVDVAIGAATVYRTLNLLVEIGVASRVRLGGDSASFEPVLGRAHHDHLICVACGAVVEFEDDAIEKRQNAIVKKHGFLIRSHRLEIFGVCPRCQARA